MPSKLPPKKSSNNSDKREAPPDHDPIKNSSTPKSILDRWDISAQELTTLVDDNPSLRGMMLGYVAELKFRELIESHPGISSTRKHDDHDRKRKSDREIAYKGERFTVEVKSLQTNSIKFDQGVWRGRAQVDGSDRRIIKFSDGSELNTTLLLRGEFDILAVNCFAFENTWRFIFALNRDLPTSKFRRYTPWQREQLLASLAPVSWPPEPPFVSDPASLIDILLRERLTKRRHEDL